MQEIFNTILSILENDHTLTTLLGGTNSDSRFYGFPETTNIQYNSSTPGAVIYRSKIGVQPTEFCYPSQWPDASIYFQVIGLNATASEEISEQILNILRNYSPLNTSNWKVGILMIGGKSDEILEGSATFPLSIRNVRIRLKDIFQKSAC